MSILKIANRYGNVDVRKGLSKSYRHVSGKRLQPLCRRLGIKFAPALVEFEESGPYIRPVFDGVVVWARSAPKLLEAITARNINANSPAALAKKEKARQLKNARALQRVAKCNKLGIDPDGRTANWLDAGCIDDDLAELIGFRTAFRHKHTDYDACFDPEEFSKWRSFGYSPQETREEMRAEARTLMQPNSIPATWPEYLHKYEFDSPVAIALSRVLKSTTGCHPTWFKEAEIAVRRAGLPLDGLRYEAIKEAIGQWRDQRAA